MRTPVRLALLVTALVGVSAGVVVSTSDTIASADPRVARVSTDTVTVGDGAGVVWDARRGFEGGTGRSRVTDVPIDGTTDDLLYQSEHYGMTGFSTAVPAPGTYRVTLRLAEIYFANAGERVFDVDAEGSPALRDVDIAAQVGMHTAYDPSFTVAVADGVLDLDFRSTVNFAKVSAVQVDRVPAAAAASPDVRPAKPGTTTAPRPTATAVAPSPTARALSRPESVKRMSRPPAGTTSSTPMALPPKVVAGYWMKWSASENQPLAGTDSRYNTILLAFAQGREGTGAVTLDQSVQPQADFVADVRTVRARGQRVILSIGGAHGLVDVSTAERRQQFLDSVLALHEEFPFDGLDWDIEGLSIHVDNMRWISEQLKSRLGPTFNIMMAPQYHVDEYKQLAQALGTNLDYIGVQFYDYPEASQQARIDGVKDLVKELVGFYQVDPSTIGIGMRVHGDDRAYVKDGVASNWWSLRGSSDGWKQLEAQYPTLRGVYLWEISADRKLGSRWIATMAGPVTD